MGLKRAKKKDTRTNDNLIGFRTPSIKEKERINRELEELNTSVYDLVVLALDIKKQRETEETLLAKRSLEIHDRNTYLTEAKNSNLRVQALNRQLKTRFNKNIDENDGVIDIEMLQDLFGAYFIENNFLE